jgi:tetratricopeptide (TPR) repeat protein
MTAQSRSEIAATTPTPARRPYIPAVGPRLHKWLVTVFILVALLVANSVYLSSITIWEAVTGETIQNFFYQYMFLGHLVLGLALIGPFLVFVTAHLINTRHRLNRRAIRVGYFLLAASLAVLISGVLLMRLGPLDLRQPALRAMVYWLHVAAPLVVLWLYWLHRLAGPRIRWRAGLGYIGAVAAACAAMLLMHRTDPRPWYAVGPKEGEKYFHPSLTRTATGNFIPAPALMNDAYCRQCHADVHEQWSNSVHRFSSFNNPAYLASVRETREYSTGRQGNVHRARWCAGCHDPVPLFSGAFDDPKYDDVHDPTAHAGITCTVCHAITNVNSTRGNADYTIEEPLHYPFAYSENAFLQWVNQQLVKAKPEFHKKTFLKPFHKHADFCSTCHKVHLPVELNEYKFVRGQNHHDPFLLSGVSGHGARSFYYPPHAKQNCASCHMPLVASEDFGAKFFDGATELSVHNHLFPAANTAVAWFRNRDDIIAAHQAFLKDIIRVDLFGVREEGAIDGKLIAPIRPQVPSLAPGRKYLLEVVIRTLKLGHIFTQGTADSNEIWLDVTVTSGDRVVGRMGGMNPRREVDPWTHFVNVFLLDRNGNRIDRRNPQDIFVPLYNNQIPPGAAQTVHLGLEVPPDAKSPLVVDVKLHYRKFDSRYMDFVTQTAKEGDLPIRGHRRNAPYLNELPITTLATDRVEFPVGDTGDVKTVAAPATSTWERFNDYGIGLLLKDAAELRQAEQAFIEVKKLGRYDGPLNMARVYEREGRLDEAVAALRDAGQAKDPPAPPWTIAWLTGVVNRQQGHLEEAERNFRAVLAAPTEEMRRRGFDFRLDYEVINLLAQTLFDRAMAIRDESHASEREKLLRQAAEQFEATLKLDVENVPAHYGLFQVYTALGDRQLADRHAALHAKYKPDDNARDSAVAAARRKYPAANRAAEKVVIYDLRRPGAPGLDAASAQTTDAAAGGGQ